MAISQRLCTCARVIGIAIALQAVLAQGQQCYYPNGKEAPEKPCSSAEGSACCPDKWQCLDNGLCYYEPDKLHGRYSCTDKSWQADGCPSNLCSYGGTAYGGESITQCSTHNNQWCCNADATNVHCCDEDPEPRPFFDLGQGIAYATIGGSSASEVPNLKTISGSATFGADNQPSSTPAPQSEAPSSSPRGDSSSASATPTPTGPTTPVTSLQTRISSGSTGIATIVITSILQPSTSAAPASSPPSSSSSSKVPIIVGCAVGIPLGLALAGILIWLLRKRRSQKAHPYAATPDPYTNTPPTPEFAGGAKLHKPDTTTYKNESNVPELMGQSVGPGRPISTIQGKAELESGSGFAPGAVPHAPHLVGVGGGTNGHMQHTPQSSWGSAPPGYSPGMNQNAWVPAQDGTAGGAVTEGGRYIPYRPPPGHAAHTAATNQPHHLSDVPEAAELSAVRTPPA